PLLRPGQTLLFAHGFAIHYRTIIPPNDIDVIMVAPKGLGPMVRSQFVAGQGVPCVIAVRQDVSGHARELALAYAKAISGTRAGISETAKWSDVSVGPKIIDASVKTRMKRELEKIRRGRFARDWLRETATGKKRYQRLLDKGQTHLIEQVGERLRRLMP